MISGEAAFPPTATAGPEIEDLSRRYWTPIRHFFRVAGAASSDDANDLTQSFYAWLLERTVLAKYDPARGSFRSFLKAVLRHFLDHERRAAGRLKRGGGLRRVPLDPDVPAVSFERAWRVALLSEAVERVRDRSLKFTIFEEYTFASGERPTYRALAERHGLKPSDVMNCLAAVREALRRELRAVLTDANLDEGCDDDVHR